MILCVDPDASDRAATVDALETAGFDARGVETAAAARDHLAADGEIACVATEADLPDGSGLELLDDVRGAAPDAACVLYTDVPLADVETEAFADVIAEYVPKTDDSGGVDQLEHVVEHSLAFRSQTAYPLPEREEARLAALERYAADPAALSESLGRLTELAVAQFDVNSAAVGLIDAHRERFLSCHGASFDTTDREETICTYTILEDGVTVVEDISEDPRFSDIDGLRDANVRFYAGAPMTTPEGLPIGVFCLHDDAPRSVSERGRELLTLFADEAMEQLELRRAARDRPEDRVDE